MRRKALTHDPDGSNHQPGQDIEYQDPVGLGCKGFHRIPVFFGLIVISQKSRKYPCDSVFFVYYVVFPSSRESFCSVGPDSMPDVLRVLSVVLCYSIFVELAQPARLAQGG